MLTQVPSLRDVNVRHLAALAAVVDEGSFAKAAQSLGFTQSAISQQIAALERAVGLPVLDRPKGPRPAELTAAGQLVLELARQTIGQVASLDDQLDRLRRGISGRLVIGTFQSASAELLPAMVARMRAELADVEIRLVESDDQLVLLDALVSDELDLSFTVDVADDPRVETSLLGFDPFVVISATGDLDADHATPADLDGRPMIGQTANSVCQLLIDQRLEGAGIRPDYVFRSQDNGAVQGMVRSGMGRAIMPVLAIDRDDPGITVLDLDPPIAPRGIQLARRRGRSLPPAADQFLAVAREVCAEVLVGEVEPAR